MHFKTQSWAQNRWDRLSANQQTENKVTLGFQKSRKCLEILKYVLKLKCGARDFFQTYLENKYTKPQHMTFKQYKDEEQSLLVIPASTETIFYFFLTHSSWPINVNGSWRIKLINRNKVLCSISVSGHQKIYEKSISFNCFNLRSSSLKQKAMSTNENKARVK